MVNDTKWKNCGCELGEACDHDDPVATLGYGKIIPPYTPLSNLKIGLDLTEGPGKSALGKQEGGDHYRKLKIQPIEYIHANSIPFAEGSVIKYVTRWRDKNGIADLKKAKHFLELLIELEEKAVDNKL